MEIVSAIMLVFSGFVLFRAETTNGKVNAIWIALLAILFTLWGKR